ncbi:MAG TPA: vWA domain-containing protein [Thermoanaerobaculia bacterium]|nr:vWA domain-containing protein [Thermoanaerobaculia bacterium]
MRRRFLIAVALLLMAGLARAQKLGPVDWIFLVDTSKSMKPIFGEVQNSLKTFVREANDGDSIAIYTFDRDVTQQRAVSVDPATRAELEEAIDRLTPKGNRTHIGAAIARGLEQASSLRAASDPIRKRTVVLFTDGKEDVRGIDHPIPIEASIPNAADTFIFFVSLNELEPKINAFQQATAHTTVLEAPNAEAVREVARRIRSIIPPEQPPVLIKTETAKPPSTPPPTKPLPAPAPVWLRVLRWTIPILILAAAAFFFLQQRRRKNCLEGELEILRPQTPPELAFVGLPKLRTVEVALSALLPVDALNGSDARLFVKRKEGKKKIWIAANGGGLRINDVETPLSELYDADTIELGAAKLRFNRVGGERPYESEFAN